MYTAHVLADSVSPSGHRLTTFEIVYPRFILAEFNTHRMLSRSNASSRAVPVSKHIEAVKGTPFVPEILLANKSGMQGGGELPQEVQREARSLWFEARDKAVHVAEQLARLNVHKQTANRVLEPFLWQRTVVTATEWSNFFHLRCHPDAQPEFQIIAKMMRDALRESVPQEVGRNHWHLPYITDDDRTGWKWGPDATDVEKGFTLAMVSAARCARVSYLTHEGTKSIDNDIALADRLLKAGHMSPFEHPAMAQPPESVSRLGNFTGWTQYRKLIPNEDDPLRGSLEET